MDTVVGDFLDGDTAEEIAVSYPTLNLEDVYGAISYYLANRTAVDEYLSRRRQEAHSIQAEIEQRFPPDGLRSRLVARADEKRT